MQGISAVKVGNSCKKNPLRIYCLLCTFQYISDLLNDNWNFLSYVARIKIKARQTRLRNWTAAMALKTWKRRLPRGSFPSPSEPMETRKIQTQVRGRGRWPLSWGLWVTGRKVVFWKRGSMELFGVLLKCPVQDRQGSWGDEQWWR